MTREKLKRQIAELEALKKDFEKERMALEKKKDADPVEKAILRAMESGVSMLLRDCRLREALYSIT